MKIGIFGGCFNPVHNMHKDIGISLIKEGYVDKVIFVPTGDNYSKKDLIEHKKRVEMLKYVADNVKTLVSDICASERYVYTYEIMDYYKELYKNDELYFVLGTDNLEHFNKWKEYEYILSKYKLLVIARNDDNIEEILKKYLKFNSRIVIANIEPRKLSSTMIREYLKEEKYEELKDNMDNNVMQYIIKNRLYK